MSDLHHNSQTAIPPAPEPETPSNPAVQDKVNVKDQGKDKDNKGKGKSKRKDRTSSPHPGAQSNKKSRPGTSPASLDLELATVQYLYPPATPHLRKVAPYYYDFTTYAKGRWLNQPLLAMFDKEFADRPKGYYARAIASGLIQVNGRPVAPEYVIRNQDRISHRNHRHEPPVTSSPVRILALSAEYVVVDKPASIPVHPTGRYRHNSLIHLLQYYWHEWTGTTETPQPSSAADTGVQRLGPTLYPIHRLDRLTSGVLLLCQDRTRIAALTTQFQSKVVGKEYLARVRGRFPASPVECSAPITVLHHKLGLSHVDPVAGKPALTRFSLLAYRADIDESLVRVRPVTGRTHQIRVHLRHLGYPITNDPVYNNPGHRHVVKDHAKWAAATRVAKGGAAPTGEQANMQGWQDAEVAATDKDTQAWVEAVGQAKLAADAQVVGQCDACGSDLLADPAVDDMFLYLHAFKYSVAGDLGLATGEHVSVQDGITTIRTPLPHWAVDGWDWTPDEGMEPVVLRAAAGDTDAAAHDDDDDA